MPSRSSAISSDSASMPSKLMFARVRHARRPGRRSPRARTPGRGCRAPGDRAGLAISPAVASACAREPPPPRPSRPCAGTFSVPRAAVPFLAAAGHLRHQPHAASNPQRADALGSAELVRRQRQQIDARAIGRTTGTLPTACTASVWSSAPARAADAAPSRRGLHACRSRCWPASPRRARCPRSPAPPTASGSTMPSARRRESRPPRRPCAASAFAVLSTASCSMPVVTSGGGRSTRALHGAPKGEVVRLRAARREHDLRSGPPQAGRPPPSGPGPGRPWPAARRRGWTTGSQSSRMARATASTTSGAHGAVAL